MKKLLLIGLVITGIAGSAQAYDTEQTHIKNILTTDQQQQAPGFVQECQTPLAEGLTEKEIQQRQEEIRQQAESKEFSKYWKISSIFFGS